MDQYRLVENKNAIFTEKHENEVRLTGYGHITNYIEYTLKLLEGTATEPAVRFVNLQAMGKAISKAVSVAEFTKRKFNGLHQITKLESFEITDVYEPLVEGLNIVSLKRKIPSITITLSLDPLDKTAPGYQPPVKASAIQTTLSAKAQQFKIGHDRHYKGKKGKGKGSPSSSSSSASASTSTSTPSSSTPVSTASSTGTDKNTAEQKQ